MAKGKRAVGLNKPCPRCGREVPAAFVSPIQEGLCGKCTDELQRQRKDARPSASTRLVRKVPGGGHTIIGFLAGIAVGILACLALAVFADAFWGDLVEGIRGMMGR